MAADTTMSPAQLRELTADQVLATVLAITILSLVAVLLRLYTRFVVIKNAAIEDFYISLAMLFSIGTAVCTCYELKYGLGRRMVTLNPIDITVYFQYFYASLILYNFALLFTKISILLQYLRINTRRVPQTAVYCALGFVVLFGVESFITTVFQCTPISFFWDISLPNGSCIDKWALYFAHAGINIFTDFVILALPVLILRDLQASMWQKVCLGGIIALGGFACIASITRLTALHALSLSKDLTYDGPPTATWTCIELNIGIICASISTLRPLFSLLPPITFTSSSKFSFMNRQSASGFEGSTKGSSPLRLDTGVDLEKGKVSDEYWDEKDREYELVKERELSKAENDVESVVREVEREIRQLEVIRGKVYEKQSIDFSVTSPPNGGVMMMGERSPLPSPVWTERSRTSFLVPVSLFNEKGVGRSDRGAIVVRKEVPMGLGLGVRDGGVPGGLVVPGQVKRKSRLSMLFDWRNKKLPALPVG